MLWLSPQAKSLHATCTLRTTEVDQDATNNGIVANMPHPLGAVRNQVDEREHKLSHVERRVETRF